MDRIDEIFETYLIRALEVEPTDSQIGEWIQEALASSEVEEHRNRCLGVIDARVVANAIGCAVIGRMGESHRAADAYRSLRAAYRAQNRPFDGTCVCARILGIAEERAKRIAQANAGYPASEVATALREGRLEQLLTKSSRVGA